MTNLFGTKVLPIRANNFNTNDTIDEVNLHVLGDKPGPIETLQGALGEGTRQLLETDHVPDGSEEPELSQTYFSENEESESLSEDDDYHSVFGVPLHDNRALDVDHPLFGFTPELTRSVLEHLSNPNQPPIITDNPPTVFDTHDGKGVCDSSSTSVPAKRSVSPAQGKRWDSQELEQETDSEDENTVFVNKRSQLPHSRGINFACPFAVRFPDKHHACFVHISLPDMSSVSHHVCGAHRRPYYCPVCYRLFDTGAERDNHARCRICSLQASTSIEGATEQQMRTIALGERELAAGRSGNQEGLWFSAYETLFPEDPRPPTAYLHPYIDVVVSAFRKYWLRCGTKVVSDFLAVRAPGCWEGPAHEKARESLQATVLEQMVDEVLGPNWWSADKAGDAGEFLAHWKASHSRLHVS
ncbi:hypothetical protein GQ53DRAFT_852510 [Thozetella sp. PMI_491]|nr:hypothetical protein GQ53DRAFT_852510 [Thozetella sp. PMI_491]